MAKKPEPLDDDATFTSLTAHPAPNDADSWRMVIDLGKDGVTAFTNRVNTEAVVNATTITETEAIFNAARNKLEKLKTQRRHLYHVQDVLIMVRRNPTGEEPVAKRTRSGDAADAEAARTSSSSSPRGSSSASAAG